MQVQADGRRRSQPVTPNYDWVVLCASNAGDQLTLVNEWTSTGLISREVVGSTTGGSGTSCQDQRRGRVEWGNEKSDRRAEASRDRGLTAAETRAAHAD